MAGGNCCGSGLLGIQRPNGSPNQLTEACGWEQIPRCLIRDRDGAYGEILSAAFDRSAFETARRLPVHHGKTRTQNGLSARSQGMPRSYRGVRRTPSAPSAAVLYGLL